MSKKRTEIESAAAEAVQRRGLHDLSFRTLADEVGVKSASVHYYFPNKSDLATTLIGNYTKSLTNELKEIDTRKRGLKGKLDGFVQIFEDVIKADKLCLCGMMAAEVGSLDNDNRELLRKYFELAENWIVNVLVEHESEINSELKPRKLAKIFVAGLEGAILLDRVDNGLDHLKAQRELIRSFIGKVNQK